MTKLSITYFKPCWRCMVIKPDGHTMNNDFLMTGAELQCLREACGLDRDQLGERCGVQGRTLKYWEMGTSNHGVPADVVALVLDLEAQITRDTAEELARCDGLAEVVLMRGADPVKNEIASRVYLELRQRGRVVRMVAFEHRAYRAWLDAARGQDTPANRQAWAVQAVKEQAKPHRADQPG